ncbi:hypothetical protein [Kordia jejudonensis]|uniref:hypothetical protein n=1 Tax=Kordia jejudonensis TaxID=1348245 RepID=UPI0012E06F3E|nr:hypothetical protein [Kordia jejudonensis]
MIYITPSPPSKTTTTITLNPTYNCSWLLHGQQNNKLYPEFKSTSVGIFSFFFSW